MQLLTWLHVSDYRNFFGTLKDDSLEINTLALNNCFSYRNVFQNDVSVWSKMVLKKTGFLSKKPPKFGVVSTIRFCLNFTSMWCTHFWRKVWRDFRLSMWALATVAGNNFNGKFTAKVDADIGSLKSLYTLFDKYLDQMLLKFEQNRIVWTI